MRASTAMNSGLSILQRKENKRMKIRREMFFISRLLFFASRKKLPKFLVPRSPFPVPRSPFPVPRSSFLVPGVPRKRYAFLGWVSSFIVIIDKLCRLLYNHKDFYTQRTVLL